MGEYTLNDAITMVFLGDATSYGLPTPELTGQFRVVAVVDNKGNAGVVNKAIGGLINGGHSVVMSENFSVLMFVWNGKEYNIIAQFNYGSSGSGAAGTYVFLDNGDDYELPAAGGTGDLVTVKIDGTTGSVVTAAGGALIDGQASYTFTQPMAAAGFVWSGTQWRIV